MNDTLAKRNRRPSPQRTAVSEGLQPNRPDNVMDTMNEMQPRAVHSPRRRRNVQAILPNPPRIPGYHSTWIGGEGSMEMSIRSSAIREGYSPISYREAAEHDPSWDPKYMPPNLDDNDLVRINEKVAYKVPLEDYHQIMSEIHHYEPMESEEGAKDNLQNAPGRNHGMTIREEDDGLSFAGKTNKRPDFSSAMNTVQED